MKKTTGSKLIGAASKKGGSSWQTQALQAQKAREMGGQIRKDKPKSFRRTVGAI